MKRKRKALTNAERQKERRKRLRLEEVVNIRIEVSGHLHRQLSKEALLTEMSLKELIIRKLSR